MRVALVHDWLTGLRGGERVLDVLARRFPDAELFTLFHRPGTTTGRIDALRIHESWLARLPGAARYRRLALPLYPAAVEGFDLTGFDLVISVSHAVAKGARAGGAPHLCYCLTPMRYVWDQADAYLGRGLRRALAAPLLSRLRDFDVRTSGPDRVTRFTAISEIVAERIRRHYGRETAVVYPPVDLERFRPDARAPEDYFLLVGAFVPYKREAVAVEAFRRLGSRLVVVGVGPGRDRLRARAPRNVEFVGRVPDTRLADLYARCRAVVFVAEEDFGLVPVEAQAAGRPVIAFGRGGVVETVVDLDRPRPTGVLFAEQTVESLVDAVERFERVRGDLDPLDARANAERFSTQRFWRGFEAEIEATLKGGKLAPVRGVGGR